MIQKIYVQILHYGDVLATLSCLQSLLSQIQDNAGKCFYFLISSNGTADDDDFLSDWARDNFSSFREVWAGEIDFSYSLELMNEACILVRNNKNLGFASGYNPAIKLALLLGADAIWLLNNDTFVQKDALSSLRNCYNETNGKSLIGATVVDINKPKVIQCAGGMNFNPYTTCVSSMFAGESLEKIEQLQEEALDYIYGASILVPAQVFQDIGLLDEDFFLFYEELDLCRRAQRVGYSLTWCREVIVRHRGSEGKDDSYLRILHDVRSFTLFIRKHYPAVWGGMALVHAIGRILMQVKNRNFGGVCAVCKGLLQGAGKTLRPPPVSG